MDTGSVNSLQTSMANSSTRSTPISHNYKPLTPSSSILALSNMPDEEMRRRGSDDLVQIVRRLENGYRGVLSEHDAIMKDMNKKMQILLLEARGVKDINQNLQDDNQELRDLCCFLDDDRQRGRKLAREWQRFGRYTASVMRSEVSAYQEKLKELEQKQQELIVDNQELKELCLFLDGERLRVQGGGLMRDEGDGSSSSTIAGGEDGQSDGIDLLPLSQLYTGANSSSNPVNNDYVHQLEEQIRNLEEEKRAISQDLYVKKNKPTPSGNKPGAQVPSSGSQRLGPDGTQVEEGGKGPSPAKPEAVVHAMKVLEVHENLERPHTSVGEENLDDKEKAIVREMCNVVWRKLGNVSAEQQESGTSTPQHPVYENLQPGGEVTSDPRNDPRTDPRNDPRNDPTYSVNPQMHHSYPPHSYQSQYYQQPTRSNNEPSRSNKDLSRSNMDPSRSSLDSGHPYSHHGKSNMDPGGTGDIYRAQPLPQQQRPHTGQGSQYNHQGQGHPGGNYQPPHSSQSQRPTPSSYPTNGPAPPPAHHPSQPPSYGYVRTTHSTPVTPTPLQRSHSPVTKPASKLHPRPEARSHSPGPNRVPNTRPDPNTHSQGQQPSSTHLYQNHPMGKGDHSYENIQYGYNPTSSQSYLPSEGRPGQSSSSGRKDHPPPPHIGSQYSHSDIAAPSPGYAPRGYQQQPPPQTSSHDPHPGHPPTHYQNVQGRQPATMKHPRRDPSPQGYNLRQGSNTAPPPQGSFRNKSGTPTYSQQYPPPDTPQLGRRPAQPQYNRDGYPDPRDVPRQYQDRGDGRGRQNQYN